MGVQSAGHHVAAQLERHDFGRETVEANLPFPFINEKRWEAWEDHSAIWGGRDGRCRWCFGNPRCTGFSTLTAGYSEAVHGHSAKCTQDIHEVCRFGVQQEMDLVIWESVQQAYTVGRPLLRHLLDEYFRPAGYRVAHVFLNASSFGNAQRRRRYFFVAYRGDRNFNVEAPQLPDRQVTVRDVIESYEGLETSEGDLDGDEYVPESYKRLTPDEKVVVPHLYTNESLNGMARRSTENLTPRFMERWKNRTSNMPFSLHTVKRISYDGACPTIHSSADRMIHPDLDRPLTVRELSRLMGWPEGMTPRGPDPAAQVGKGICPEVGTWLARQAELFLSDAWGDDDWDTAWCPDTSKWRGTDLGQSRPDEKVLDLGRYVPCLADSETEA
jgi:site-specific DNA-cytosine methylase